MAHLINDRWLRIPEEAIYRLFLGLGDIWQVHPVLVAGSVRYYLTSLPYAYPYSLPVEVTQRLAAYLNEGLMFDYNRWYMDMLADPGYNDAGVEIAPRLGAPWMVLGVHRLTDAERPPYPTVYFDVRCKEANRDGMKPVYWSWVGMQPHETPHPVFADKLMHEVPALAIMPGMVIAMWMADSDLVRGFERDHSYFVVFQEKMALPQTVSVKELVLSASVVGLRRKLDHVAPGMITLEIDKDLLDSLPVDKHNRVTLIVPVYR